ncbi:uncharacterized protein LOC119731375 [Patiria miniata]|uniref:CCHC-type domain-containing protein n=1 Tax=Patiria miniata TaxID=46514 RepID=A0A914A9P2_PATMI|nr:uncharacterized protein LOC119731375 [Patiria miniata]
MSTTETGTSRHGESRSASEHGATSDTGGHDDLIRPQDSVSQCRSKVSRTSTSVTGARVKAAARKVALEAEAAMLHQLQALEDEELKLHQRKRHLALQTKLAMAEAEEAVYALNDSNEHCDTFSVHASNNSEVQIATPPQSTPEVVDTSPACQTTKLEFDGMKEPDTKPEAETTVDPNKTSEPDKTVDPVKTAEPDSAHKNSETTVLELVQQGQKQQQRLLEVIQLPKAELLTYDGDPLQYWAFIRSFENSVDNSNLEDSAKLIRLLQYCTGKAKKVIQCCSVMQPLEGYKRAKALLKERFGNNYTIAEAWVNKLTEGSSISPHDKKALREYADDLKTCRETLNAMGYIQEVNTQTVLVTLIEKLPSYLRNRWIKQVRVIRIEFVEDAAEEANDPVYGALSKPKDRYVVTNKNVPKSSVSRYSKGSYTMMTNAKPGNMTCVLCNGSHTLFGCTEFKSKKPEDRFEFARATKLCYNCLRPGHMSNSCTLNRVCSVAGCGKKHTKFLHRIKTIPVGQFTPRTEVTTAPAEPAASVQSGFTDTEVDTSCNVTGVGVMGVALPIVPVKVKAKGSGVCIDTYALLDSGSTSTFCTEELAKRLKLCGQQQQLSLTTLAGANVQTATTVISLTVSGIDCKQPVELPLVYTRRELPIHDANLAKQEDIEKWPHLQGLKLPQVDKGRVQLLIGQDVPEALMPLEVKKGERNAPYATRTELGWSLNGPLGMANKHTATSNFIAADDSLERQLKMFWKLDTTDSIHDDTKGMSVKDKQAIAIWEESVRLTDGHYELAIPFKNYPPHLVDNRTVAERRLFSLGKRLQRDTLLHAKYTEGMQDLINNGYGESVPEEEVHPSNSTVWYLPHHLVYHPKKPDKVCIVFDCASKHVGTSLNDEVLSGPDLTNKLLGVLLRFRQETVALMADVQAMFHQVKVTHEERDVLRYLWWSDGDSSRQPSVYRMTVHPFGGTWSPSCCTFALQRTAEDNRADFQPDTVDTVMRNFYVDDCLKSVASEEKGIQLAQELRSLLARGGFRLTKWVSSNPQVLASIPIEERVKDVKELDLNYEALPTESALGMQWDVELDCFGYKISPSDKPLTRRGILSVCSSIYDPHGFVSPFTLRAKVFIQDLCRRKLGWDESLPSEHLNSWQQ